MTFRDYVEVLQDFLKDNPDTGVLKVCIKNGYATASNVLEISRVPYIDIVQLEKNEKMRSVVKLL